MTFLRPVQVFDRILCAGPGTGESSCNSSVIGPGNVSRVGWRNLPGMNSHHVVRLMMLMDLFRPLIRIHSRIGMTMSGSSGNPPGEIVNLLNAMEIPGSDPGRSGRRQHWEQMTC
jgi:hypothetical protein